MTNASGCDRMNQFGNSSGPRLNGTRCCSMISRTLSDPESRNTPTSDSPRMIPYDTTCAAARNPPSRQ